MNQLKKLLRDRNTIVIKIGTNILTDRLRGVNRDRIAGIARSVADLQSIGNRVALVSS
jgi:glutamate 5-kinase